MKKMILLISLVFLLFSGTMTVFTYAEQNKDLYLEDDKESIKIGTIVKSENNSRLIPNGAILKTNDVYEISFEYEIFFDDNYDLDIAVGELSLTNNELSNEILGRLFNFDIKVEYQENMKVNDGILKGTDNATRALVTVTISMNMPENKAQYDVLSTSSLDFTAFFTLND